ncbi:uncharacterized protein B0H18DRAFT_1121168 [Fomitopsis serialis]|uniref:uncharacterized protein n=1 Tax=Fomitopsis serialis TaxID=139415 RepID=UPI0020080B65|nr:uncharacterized protein B0H18DRAFT_1121168 [Neoantrodia serialis]KAH9921867.1 hypothetical protein B0H18DRAFT_1121168 [Neoantrodia serialis]
MKHHAVQTTHGSDPDAVGRWMEDVDSFLELEDQGNDTVRVPIPLVTRDIIEKLLLAEEETDGGDEDRDALVYQADHRYHSSGEGQQRWPPVVTALPEARTSSSSRRMQSVSPSASTSNAIDTQFCGKAPCRLLLILTIPEREPAKIQQQLVQILALARKLNRTVVLPNVGKGRVGTCQRWDFDTYFDIASTALGGGERMMMMDDFRTWVDMRPLSPTTQVVAVDEGATESNTVVEYASMVHEKAAKTMRCFKTRFRELELENTGTATMHLLPVSEGRSNSGEAAILVNALSEGRDTTNASETTPALPSELDYGTTTASKLPRHSDSDVLLLYWDVRSDLFSTESTTAIDYSPRLWALASQVTKDLQPYLAVHWHIDKLPAAVLPACADALVDMLDILLHDASVSHDIRTVYFSSDHSLMKLASHSEDAQKKSSDQHTAAIDIIQAAFAPGGELERWVLETREGLFTRLNETNGGTGTFDEDQLPLGDTGVQDILARIVSMKAALFVSGTKGCGRLSSAARQVTDFRARAKDHGAIKDVVNLFG